MKVNKCQRWYRTFSTGDLDLSNGDRSGRPVNFDNEALKTLVEANPKLSIQELANILQCIWSTVQRHLKEIGKVYREGIWVPHLLSEINKAQRRTICTFLLCKQKSEPFLRMVVTGDEKWVLYNTNKRTKQWLSPNQTAIPTLKIHSFLHFKESVTVRLVGLWGYNNYEILKPGETITAELYCQQLDRLHKQLLVKRPGLVNRKEVILQHDNARPHAAKLNQEKIKQLNWEVLPHPPYSPDIAPSDFYLFRSMQHCMKNKNFKMSIKFKII